MTDFESNPDDELLTAEEAAELEAADVVADLLQPEDETKPEIPTEINILPLRDSIIYPMLIAPLSVARENSVQLIDESIVGNNRIIGAITQRRAQIEQPGFDDVFDVADVELDDFLALVFHLTRTVHDGPADVIADVGQLGGLGKGANGHGQGSDRGTKTYNFTIIPSPSIRSHPD